MLEGGWGRVSARDRPVDSVIIARQGVPAASALLPALVLLSRAQPVDRFRITAIATIDCP